MSGLRHTKPSAVADMTRVASSEYDRPAITGPEYGTWPTVAVLYLFYCCSGLPGPALASRAEPEDSHEKPTVCGLTHLIDSP